MSGDQDLVKLYSARILALAADMSHTARLPAPDGTARKRSPLCGSTVTVDVIVENGRITAFGQDVKACALGQASAAILGEVVIGRSHDELQQAQAALVAMLKDGAPPPAAPFDGYETLSPARDYRNRHASILLAIEATIAAMEAAQQP